MRARGGVAFRLGVSALALASVGMESLHVARLYNGFRAYHAPLLALVLQLALGPSIPFLGSLLALALLWRARDSRATRWLAFFLALVAYWIGAQSIWLVPGVDRTSAVVVVGLNIVHNAVLFAWGAALLRFSALFPVPLAPEALGRPRTVAGGRVLQVRAWLLRPRSVWVCALVLALTMAAATPFMLKGLAMFAPAVVVVFGPLLIVAQVLLIVAALANLRTGYRGADAAGRRQVFWLLEGVLAGVSIVVIASAVKVLALLTHTDVHAVDWNWYGGAILLAMLLVLAGVAIAMFFSGALDPALAIRRTAVFGVMGVTTVFVFAAVENSMQSLVTDQLGLSDHLSGLISGGLVALAFDRIKTRVDHVVERWSGHGHGRAPTMAPDAAAPPAAPERS